MTKRRKKVTRAPRTRKSPTAVAAAPRRTGILEVPLAAGDVQPLLERLRDTSQPIEARLDALQAIQAASFAIHDFSAVRPNYIAVLRQVTEDGDAELRQRALGILAREHDGFAQERLLQGLRDPAKALVSPDKALQLLNYDPHAAMYPIARDLVKTSSDKSTKREALRVLAGDPSSAPLLAEVLADKAESNEVRRMSASALHALNPDRLQRWANSAVVDTTEDEEMVATGVTALAHFGDAETIANNTQLRKRMTQLRKKGPTKIKRLAKQFLEKYER